MPYTRIYVKVSDHLYTLHLYLYLRYCVRYLCLYYTSISVTVIVLCYLYLRYFIHRKYIMLYMYFCDIISICFYVQSVKHFVDIGL